MVKKSLGDKIFNVFNIIFLAFCGLIMLFPVWNVLMTSLVDVGEYYSRPIILFPKKIYWDSYKYIFSSNELIKSVGVTTFVTIVGTIYSLILTMMLAYALSKKDLPGRKFFTGLILFTMFFSGGLIPFYMLIRNLNLINKIWVLIIPTGVNVFNFIVLKAFYTQFPESLEESAKIDGASDFYILVRIVTPLSLPSLATIALFYAVSYWNAWYNALLFITKPELYPLQLLLRKMIIQNVRPESMAVAYRQDLGSSTVVFDEGVKMATVVVATVPILCVYPFLQKYFTKGVMIGAIKG